MEVKIGVLHTPREIVLESAHSGQTVSLQERTGAR
mgnify:CR=1 FL=1